LYVGDIGDNLGGKWDHVWIYKLPEPKVLKDQTIRATQYVVKYSDGPRNAEALMVHPKTGRVYIADKDEDGGHLYEGPAHLSATGTNTFKPVAPIDLWVTDGAFSPDGRHLAVRGYFGGILYDWNGGDIKREGRLNVPLQGQGESVTYTTDGTKLMYGSEGANSPVQPQDAPGAPASDGKSPSQGGGSASGDDGGPMSGSLKVGAVAVAALLARRGRHRHTTAWRMPLWPAVPVLLIAVLAYILTQQETVYLVWTGGITAVATLYWAFYLRPRRETRWLVSIPEDEQV
ncbi:hypothetical protein ACFVJ9_58315, partial [Streptomyces sp. NPDC127574]